jgi:hypothetical protein
MLRAKCCCFSSRPPLDALHESLLPGITALIIEHHAELNSFWRGQKGARGQRRTAIRKQKNEDGRSSIDSNQNDSFECRGAW